LGSWAVKTAIGRAQPLYLQLRNNRQSIETIAPISDSGRARVCESGGDVTPLWYDGRVKEEQ